jgi:hypothetical protein
MVETLTFWGSSGLVAKEGIAEFIVHFEKTTCGLLTRLVQGRVENTSVALLSSEMYEMCGLLVSI